MNEINNFLTGKLFPMILKYSIPAAISLLITAIYNIVDRIFIGNFNGTSALAGLSIVKPQTLPTLQLQIKIIRFLYFLNCNRKLF